MVEETTARPGRPGACQVTPVLWGIGAEESCSCPPWLRIRLEEMLAVGGVQELVLGLPECIGKQRPLAVLPRL